jgi:microcystin-dependent protein
VDPSVLFGGAWARISNAFLWGADPTGTIGATGGESEHWLTRDEIPYHTHDFEYSTSNGASFTSAKAGKDGNYTGDNYLGFSNSVTEFASYQVRVAGAGGGNPHNNMPPYIQVSIWRRIA